MQLFFIFLFYCICFHDMWLWVTQSNFCNSQFFQKTNKNNSTWGVIVLFFGKIEDIKSPFGINWSLLVCSELILKGVFALKIYLFCQILALFKDMSQNKNKNFWFCCFLVKIKLFLTHHWRNSIIERHTRFTLYRILHHQEHSEMGWKPL